MIGRYRFLPLLLVFGVGLPVAAMAGDSRLELTDGSVITGEVVGIQGGRYQIHSATLGEISIPESSIRTLQPAAGSTSAVSPQIQNSASAAGYSTEIASIQKQLITDPGLMEQVMALQKDPQVQQILADPALTRKILSGDLEGLRADARFQRLMDSSAIQSIMGQVLGR